MVASGALTLAVSGGMGPQLTLAFVALLVLAWKLEKTRWQLTERIGLIVVLLSLPLFYLDWKYQMTVAEARERVGVSALAHLILFLSAVKLLQIKADRDWVFLYLISFFEVLLAAGLSISPLFVLLLGLYSLCALCTIVAFEIRKAGRRIDAKETRLLVPPDSTFLRRMTKRHAGKHTGIARRLPFAAVGLLVLIFVMALPLFLIAPRFGNGTFARTNRGLTGFVGFSESVTLGAIGELQRGNEVVMRVRVEDPQGLSNRNLKWRGIALDDFNGLGWRRSRPAESHMFPSNERGLFQLGTTEGLHLVTTQTFYLEPIDTGILFVAPRVIAVQGAFGEMLRDSEGSLSVIRSDQERISYKVFSDTTEPDENVLRADTQEYTADFARYLQLPPRLDSRIEMLARDVIARAGAKNRFDQSRAIETFLRNDYGYTLDLKAGGKDPLADFLFRVREGHCEYFATAMAVMLRTQGIASRVINGFQTGAFNDASGAYTVTQRDAHSWVEVYFPESGVWISFDPTPASGRNTYESTGLSGSFGKYAEAIELLWIQYVVSYDRQEQRSLASSVRTTLSDYRQAIAAEFRDLKNSTIGWLRSIISGESLSSFAGVFRLLILSLSAIALALLGFLLRRVIRLGFWRGIQFWHGPSDAAHSIEFYERMTRLLSSRGLARAEGETPLEFATAIGNFEAIKITEAYNRVRYGERALSQDEMIEIEDLLKHIEDTHR